MTECHTEDFEGNFTMIQNELIRNPNLSCRAYKLLCIGLSHRNDWTFIKDQIATCFKENANQVDLAMKELRELGYLHTRAKNLGDGKFGGHVWYWFRKPITDEEFKKRYRSTQNADLGKNRDSENACDIRIPTLKKTNPKKEQQPAAAEQPSSASPPVVVFLLEKGVSKRRLDELIEEHGLERLETAANAMKQANPDNPTAWITAAIKDDYKPNAEPESVIAKNKDYLKTLEPLEMKPPKGWVITILHGGIEFAGACEGASAHFFEVTDKHMITRVQEFTERIQ